MTAPITSDERAAMRALADAAFPGPWTVIEDHVRVHGVGTNPDEKEASVFEDRRVGTADARFIAAARTAVPRLLDALDTAEAEAKRLTPPCDGGCSYGDGPDEECSAHGRPVAEVWGIVTEVQRQRDEARAEVARLREEAARPAPVWDEDTVTEAVARAMFPHFFTDDRQPLRVFTETRSDTELREAEREAARRKARQALAVVREHAPVRPDRETIARAIHAAHRPTTGPTPAWDDEAPAWRQTYLDFADAVLALWPGESRATVRAEALAAWKAANATVVEAVALLGGTFGESLREALAVDPKVAGHG